jgi:fumarate hydratase class II
MKKPQRKERTLTQMAIAAMNDAVNKVIEDHRQRRMPLAIWQDGKVVLVQPDEPLVARERAAHYRTKKPHGKKS